LVCSPSNHEGDVQNIFRACCEDVLPIVLYAIEFDILTEKVGREVVNRMLCISPDLLFF